MLTFCLLNSAFQVRGLRLKLTQVQLHFRLGRFSKLDILLAQLAALLLDQLQSFALLLGLGADLLADVGAVYKAGVLVRSVAAVWVADAVVDPRGFYPRGNVSLVRTVEEPVATGGCS